MDIKLPEEFNDMEILATLFSRGQSHIGILIAGEENCRETNQPVIRVYLIGLEGEAWILQDELQAFAFGTYQSAKKFAENLAEMSAIDLLLLMNGHNTENKNNNFIQ